MMTYTEAYRAMMDGKRVRRRGWNDESYWSMEGMFRGGKVTDCEPRTSDLYETDWQVLPA